MEERVDIETFLKELIAAIDERMKKQEKSLEIIEKEIQSLKKRAKSSKGKINLDKSVLKVLRGK